MLNRTLTINGFTISEAPKYSTYLAKWANPSQALSTVNIRDSVRNIQSFHGTQTGVQLYGERLIQVAGELYANCSSDMQTLEQQIKQALILGRYTALIQDGIAKQCEVVIVQAPVFTQLENNGLERQLVEFTLRADDPFLYSQEVFTLNGTETTYESTLKLPATLPFGIGQELRTYIPIVHNQTLPIYPTYTIAGAMVNPKIVEKDTDNYLRITETLGASDTLVIDTLKRTATINGLDKSGSIEGSFFGLPNTEIALIDDDETNLNGNVSITYRKAYV